MDLLREHARDELRRTKRRDGLSFRERQWAYTSE